METNTTHRLWHSLSSDIYLLLNISVPIQDTTEAVLSQALIPEPGCKRSS